jgi:hypothetical protein
LEYFKIDSKLNQGIWKFDETNLNSDSEFGFKGKNFDILSDIGIGLGSSKELCMQCNPSKFLGECIILANVRNSKFRIL